MEVPSCVERIRGGTAVEKEERDGVSRDRACVR
jgi:hypothetical protein